VKTNLCKPFALSIGKITTAMHRSAISSAET